MPPQQHNSSASNDSIRVQAHSFGPRSRLVQQRLDEFFKSESPSFLYSRTSIDTAQQRGQQMEQTIQGFDAVFARELPHTTESSWAVEPSVPLERARGSSAIAPARENEMDVRKDEVMDPTTIPSDVSSPELKKRSQSEHLSEDAEISSQSSSQPKENPPISERKTPSDDLAPRAETAFGAVELGAAAASLLLIIRAGGVAGTKHHYPKNPYRYASVEMGDSIGSKFSGDIATAGPRIQLGEEGFWVHCYYFLDDYYKSVQFTKYQKQPLITYPAQYDIKDFCKHYSGLAPVAAKEEVTS
ncbi:hypothetical protein DL95DRAFT_418100 [Leptodontidium sp. 2 PMI_412]|nr:hypothetical protein DL95DRAFT_418100 [Leptodontidium sp. 2 PMI_412]